jgi:uncharacterized protein YybS (DUF2232 family)
MARIEGDLISRLGINPAGIAISSAIWLLPIISLEFMWLQFFAPLPVFYYLTAQGRARGMNTLSAAPLVTGLIATLTGAAAGFFFSATMLPVGYILARSAARKDAPLRSGVMAFTLLLIGWSLWSFLYGIVNSTSLYQDILSSLDQGLIAAGKAFKETSDLPVEQVLALEMTVEKLRSVIPGIMPGLLLLTMVNTVFFNMTLGQYLLRRKNQDLSPWPPFAEWRLPEQLVALVIVSGICILIPGGILRDIGFNLALLSGSLYLFQGLAVLISLLNKWQAPLSVRILIFLLVIFQAFGIIILVILGLADVWADFRKDRNKSDNDIELE